jgi:hypothetical protein
MQDFHRKVKNGTQNNEATNRELSNAMNELERRYSQLPKEKWDFDPFSQFSIKLGPGTHDQLFWCKFLFSEQGFFSHK